MHGGPTSITSSRARPVLGFCLLLPLWEVTEETCPSATLPRALHPSQGGPPITPPQSAGSPTRAEFLSSSSCAIFRAPCVGHRTASSSAEARSRAGSPPWVASPAMGEVKISNNGGGRLWPPPLTTPQRKKDYKTSLVKKQVSQPPRGAAVSVFRICLPGSNRENPWLGLPSELTGMLHKQKKVLLFFFAFSNVRVGFFSSLKNW